MSRSRQVAPLVATALLAAAVPALAHDGGGGRGEGHHGGNVLRSGIVGAAKAADGGQPLFGVQPGGASWVIDRGAARVRRDGRVRVRVRGLVFAPGEANAGTNTVPKIAATVFCNGQSAGTTPAVPFSPQGDARIDAKLAAALPATCRVPAVLLNPADATGTVNATRYIAATGA